MAMPPLPEPNPAAHDDAANALLQDTRLKFVQRTVLAVQALTAASAGAIALVHWTQPHANLMDRTTPLLLSIVLGALTWRQWRHPERMASTLWTGWMLALVGLAVPTWYYVVHALRGPATLVETLPPFGAVFPAMLMVMALFARTRQAWRATLCSWVLIAAPIVVYLLAHPDELRTPRGLELAVAFGPMSLIMPLMIPLLRGVQQRLHAMRVEGERLQALAERDALIGLYNRRAGERFLATLLAHSRDDAALILFDIDHFKRINDRFGHPAGDAVLIEVGRRCSAELGGDDIFARWGGEEFLVVLPNTRRDAGGAVAERLRRAIAAQPIAPVGQVTASFGVTIVQPQDTLPEIVQRADEALYRAKAEGRDRVVAG
jgi:diguanylate cyclase